MHIYNDSASRQGWGVCNGFLTEFNKIRQVCLICRWVCNSFCFLYSDYTKIKFQRFQTRSQWSFEIDGTASQQYAANTIPRITIAGIYLYYLYNGLPPPTVGQCERHARLRTLSARFALLIFCRIHKMSTFYTRVLMCLGSKKLPVCTKTFWNNGYWHRNVLLTNFFAALLWDVTISGLCSICPHLLAVSSKHQLTSHLRGPFRTPPLLMPFCQVHLLYVCTLFS